MESDATQHNPPTREDILARLYADGLGEIRYPAAAGCAGSRAGRGGPPGSCPHTVTCAANRTYRYPRPQVVRILLCDRHGALENVEPLNDDDRAELARRQENAAYWHAVVQRQRRAAGQVASEIDF